MFLRSQDLDTDQGVAWGLSDLWGDIESLALPELAGRGLEEPTVIHPGSFLSLLLNL